MRRVIGVLALTLAACIGGQAGAQELSQVETDKLRLLYFDPTETYLVPRVIQTFHNSADRQESILGYVPDDKITVLLTDFSDYGNAGANSAPRNTLAVAAKGFIRRASSTISRARSVSPATIPYHSARVQVHSSRRGSSTTAVSISRLAASQSHSSV